MDEELYDRIFVKNLLLRMYLGIRDREKVARQKVRFSIDAYVLRRDKQSDDNISSTVSYSDLIAEVRKIAASGKFGLAETLAEKIADNCLKHNKIKKITVQVEKPQASFEAESVGVEITRFQKEN